MDGAAELLTIGEAAKELHVSVGTLRRWVDRGALRCVRTPGGQRRFRRAEIERIYATPEGDS